MDLSVTNQLDVIKEKVIVKVVNNVTEMPNVKLWAGEVTVADVIQDMQAMEYIAQEIQILIGGQILTYHVLICIAKR